MAGNKKLLNTGQVMERLLVSRRTLYRMMDSGSLEAYKIRGSLRFREVDVDRLIEESRIV